MVIISAGGLNNNSIATGAYLPLLSNGTGNDSVAYINEGLISSIGVIMMNESGFPITSKQETTNIVPDFLMTTTGDLIYGWQNF